MSIRIPEGQLLNVQTVEAEVAGPDEANRLFTVSGMAQLNLSAFANTPNVGASKAETFTLLIGPQLTRRQFHKAIASVSITNVSALGATTMVEWTIIGVDADWDDEAQQVELRVELQVRAQVSANQATVTINRFGFQVTILAQL